MRIFRIFNGLKSRRPSQANVRRVARSRRPMMEMEQCESRELLSNVPTPLMLINNPIAKVTPGQVAPMNFTVTLASPYPEVVYAQYQTVDRTAKAGTDYRAFSGWVVFAPGQTSQTITTTLLAGGAPGSIDEFGVTLSNAYNANIITPQGYGTISYANLAAPPSLSIASSAMTRGLDGSKTMVFNVNLNNAQSYPINVTASTSNVNAIAGVDYQATSQTLTIQPGQKTAQFSVTIYGKTSANQSTQLFYVNLSNAVSDTGKTVPMGTPSTFGILYYGV